MTRCKCNKIGDGGLRRLNLSHKNQTADSPQSPVLLHLHRVIKLIIIFAPRNSHLLFLLKVKQLQLLDQRFCPFLNTFICCLGQASAHHVRVLTLSLAFFSLLSLFLSFSNLLSLLISRETTMTDRDFFMVKPELILAKGFTMQHGQLYLKEQAACD